VKFHITTTLSDYVAAVFEQDAGGKSTNSANLVKPSTSRRYAFPARTTGEMEEVSQLNATFSLLGHRLWLLRTSTRRRKLQKLEALVDRAEHAGIDITVDDMTNKLRISRSTFPRTAGFT